MTKQGTTFVAAIWAKQARFAREMASYYRRKQVEWKQLSLVHDTNGMATWNAQHYGRLVRSWERIARQHEEHLKDLSTLIEYYPTDARCDLATRTFNQASAIRVSQVLVRH